MIRVEAMNVVRNRPLSQNDLELCRQGRRDGTHQELSSLWDNFLFSMLA